MYRFFFFTVFKDNVGQGQRQEKKADKSEFVTLLVGITQPPGWSVW